MVGFSRFKITKNAQSNKKNSHLHPLSTLLPYIKRYRKMVVGAVVCLVVAAAVMLALPVAIRRMLDYGFSNTQSMMMNSYFFVLFVLAAILGVASAGRYFFVITLGERLVAALRCDVFSHVTTLSPGFFDQAQSGEIVSRLFSDTTQIKSAVGAMASVALRNIIMALGAVVMMVVTSPKLSALVLLSIPIVVIPLIAFGRKVRTRTRVAQDKLAQANALASEQITAMRTVQAFTAEQTVSTLFSRLIRVAFQAAQQSIFARSLLTGGAIFLVFGSVVGVLWIGSHDVLNGHMSAGVLGQFLLYAVFAASSFGQLSEVGAELAQAAGAAERLVELLNAKTSIITPSPAQKLPSPFMGHITFDRVGFSYPTRLQHPSLIDLTFDIKHGETIAFVGPSGAGKSTIFSLLLRFYDPQKGKICLDGANIKNVEPHDVRSHMSYVPQDVTIFNASLYDNIAFGSIATSPPQVIAAAKMAQAYDFIMALKDGFDTQVGERGITLSGGQKQRIALARAVLSNAPILLLDEATSALDAESEVLVQKALGSLMQNKTTLVIAHRLATVLKADRILVMDGGKIVEQGTHDELVANGGLYARLAKLQFSPALNPQPDEANGIGLRC